MPRPIPEFVAYVVGFLKCAPKFAHERLFLEGGKCVQKLLRFRTGTVHHPTKRSTIEKAINA
jgi:hypothetical protein